MYLITFDPILQASITVRIQVVCPHEDLLLPRRNRKGTHSSHNVTHGLSLLEQVDQAAMFGVESAVPVHLGVIKAEKTVLFFEFHVHVRFSRQEFVLECAKLARRADVVNFVDDGAYTWVLVKKHFGDEAFVGQVVLAEVEVRLRPGQ